MNTLDKIIALLKKSGHTQKDLCEYLGMEKQAFTDWKSGKSMSWRQNLPQIAEYLGVSVDSLVGKPITPNVDFLGSSKVRMIPVFESVSAGFGAYADAEISEYYPAYIEHDAEAKETMYIRVTGDSMFPKIEDGDLIQAHKQSSVDSGSIAVILRDGEDGLVKKVIYGNDWIELHSFNPYYKTERYEGEDVLRITVVGLVKKVIKSVSI